MVTKNTSAIGLNSLQYKSNSFATDAIKPVVIGLLQQILTPSHKKVILQRFHHAMRTIIMLQKTCIAIWLVLYGDKILQCTTIHCNTLLSHAHFLK